MSELRKANTDLAYFLTFTVVGWIDVFTRKELADILIERLKEARKNHGIAIYAYVIMPSHIHLIAQKVDGKLLSEWVGDFKSITEKDIIPTLSCYKSTIIFHDFPLVSWDLLNKPMNDFLFCAYY